MLKTLRAGVVMLAAVSAVPSTASPTQYFRPPGSTKPFSLAVRVGNLVYVSGAVGAAADGSFPTDFAAQATNAMDKIAVELKLAGASMDEVYKCSIALTDMNNWAAFNGVYAKYFKPDRLPVRMALGVASLGGAAVEVQCEAALEK